MRRLLYALVAVGLSAVLMTDEALPAFGNGVIHHESESQSKSQKLPKKSPKKRPRPRKAPLPVPTPIPTPKPPTLLEQGQRLYDQRFFTQALSLLQQAVAHEPKNANCWFAMARTYEALGYIDEAQDAYRRTITLAPNHPELSRILMYPGDGERKPLWDPKRPARISEIPPVWAGFLILPPKTGTAATPRDATAPNVQPTRPPTAPQEVPTYVPPVPGTTELRSPAPVPVVPASRQPQKNEAPLYVPPTPDSPVRSGTEERKAPVYTPPSPSANGQKTPALSPAPVYTPPQPASGSSPAIASGDVSGDVPMPPIAGD